MVNLRPYQQSLVDQTRDAWARGARNVLVQLPTGGGKSVIIQDIVGGHTGGCFVIAHRQELVSQLSMHLANSGIHHRIVAPESVIAQIRKLHRKKFGKVFVKPNSPVIVAGVDTVLARKHKLQKEIGQTTLWMIDEAHHVTAENKWGKAAALFAHAKGLGVTATPERTDKKGLGRHADGLFDIMYCGPVYDELKDDGYLVPYQLATSPVHFEAAKLKLGADGDYTRKSLAAAMWDKAKIIGDIVGAYQQHAMGMKGLTFCHSVDFAREVAEEYNRRGIPAAMIDGTMDDIERSQIMDDFRGGKYLQITNVDILGEGVDVPDVEVVSMARPTKSIIVYLQQFGRCLRPSNGKTHGLVIDHVGNFKENGLPDTPRNWTLDSKKSTQKKGTISYTTCENCFETHASFLLTCPHCGHKRQVDRGGPETVQGDIALLTEKELDELRNRATLLSPADIARQAAFAGGPIAGRAAEKRQREKIEAQRVLIDEIEAWASRNRGGMSFRELGRKWTPLVGKNVLECISGTASEMEKLTSDLRSGRYG